MKQIFRDYKNIKAFITDTKDGNIGYHVAKNKRDKETARLNRGNIMERFFESKETQSMDSKSYKKTLLYLNQIHSNHIFAITQENLIRFYKDGKLEGTKNIKSYALDSINHHFDEINLGRADGIICESSKFISLITVADCNPILLYEPTRPVFALLHAGRLGVCSKILSKAVKILKSDFYIQAENLNVFIGASIRHCCYEIGQNLAKEFDTKYIIKNRLDMISMLKDEMRKNGLLDSKIHISNTCTCCNELYFSYRQEGSDSGRFGIFSWIDCGI